VSLEAANTVLRLSNAIYPPGSWLTSPLPTSSLLSPDDVTESWTLRSGTSAWSWRFISELKDDIEPAEDPPAVSPTVQTLLTTEALPLLVRPLYAFRPPFAVPPAATLPLAALVQADADALEEVCMLLESLCLDVEDVRLALARGFGAPAEHDGVPCLADMLDFIEFGTYHPLWAGERDAEKRHRMLDMCKAALIKAVVEVAGEEKNAEVLWEEAEDGGAFVARMVRWAKEGANAGREDLVICATLALGNLVRREAHAVLVLRPPSALAPHLAGFLAPEVDVKVKHGVLGLLKNLAIAEKNRPVLGEARVVEMAALSEVWAEKCDMAEVVQGSAVGMVKHMCNGNGDAIFFMRSTAADSCTWDSGRHVRVRPPGCFGAYAAADRA
jgi:hypothetical protein